MIKPPLRSHSLLAIVLLLAALVPCRLDAMPRPAQDAQSCGVEAELTRAQAWEGQVASRERVCLRVQLKKGQFVRAWIEAPGDAQPLEVTVLAPGDSVPFVRIAVGNVPVKPLAWESLATGTHTIVVTGSRSRARRLVVTLSAIEDPSSLMARRVALRNDPRVAWLTAHGIPIGSLDPQDTVFADLQPLRSLLGGKRVVLLGEASHGDGSDFLAKSRLIRFLHAELDFDVVAFEAGTYDMWRAWREIQAGRDAMTSFALGPHWYLAQARELEPFVSYVARVAHSSRPVILTGIDINRTGRTASADTLLAELRRFLQGTGIGGPFLDDRSPETQVLRALHDFRQPDTTALPAFAEAIATTADRIEREVVSDEAPWWVRTLRNAGLRGGGIPTARTTYCQTEACRNAPDRDPEMAQNLVWLANQMYPGRKIVVWAHNGHVMRNPSVTESFGWISYTMGDGVLAQFGKESYAIALVSYEGSHQWARPTLLPWTIIPDQHPEVEFEELMAATGHRIALLDLQAVTREAKWLGEPFLARPLDHSTDRSQWGQNYDAFLFIRTQRRSTGIPIP